MAEIGAFCETYGNTIQNRILEYILENQDLDFAVSDITKELRISKPKIYEVIKYFEEKGYVIKSRIVSKTQLYILNKKNKRVKLFLKDLSECLRLIAEEYSEEPHMDTNECKDYILARVFFEDLDITEKLLGGT
ncbi:MAG: helix-turn-helix domain-containing protein [Candidatus Woesearchaeota archaeon]